MEGAHGVRDAAPSDVAARLSLLLDAVGSIAAAGDMDEMLRRAAAAAATVTGATYAVVTLVGPDGLPARTVAHGPMVVVPEPRGGSRGPVRPDVSIEGTGDAVLTEPIPATDPHGTDLPAGEIRVGRPAPAFASADGALLRRLAGVLGPLLARADALEDAERRRRWLEGTLAIGADLAAAMRTGDVVQHLVQGVRAASKARVVALMQAQGDRHDPASTWLLVAHEGDDRAAARLALELLPDVARSGASGEVVLVERTGATPTVLIPLATELAPYGVLVVEHSAAWEMLRDLERGLGEAFARHVGLALDRVHDMGERHDLLVAADRDRIGRDLHDLVIQRLYATGLQLQAARRGDASGLDAAAQATVRDIDTAIRDLRATIFELGRGVGRSLREEARALVQEYVAILGFLPILRLTGPVDTSLTDTVADQALLVIREALSNVARHAAATAVQVELVASPDSFVVRVTDNGLGLSEDAGIASGLANARHRAERLGGALRLLPASPRGTSLVWVVPVAR